MKTIGQKAEDTVRKHLKSTPGRTTIRLNDARDTIKKGHTSPQSYRGAINATPADFLVIDTRQGFPAMALFEVKATEERAGIPFANFAAHQLDIASIFDIDMLEKNVAYFFVIYSDNDGSWYFVPGETVSNAYTEGDGQGLLSWDSLSLYRLPLEDI